MAANLEGCAVLAAAQSQPERAILLTALAATFSQTTGTVLALDEQRRLAAMLAPMRQAVGLARCAQLAEQAHAMTVEKAVAYALDQEATEPTDIRPRIPRDAAWARLSPRE